VQYRDAGDTFFNQGEYAKAKNQYEQARSYKADDRYVANRIQECNNRLVPQTPKQETAPPGMVRIGGGSFTMGSSDGDDVEKPPHQVYVDDFYMDKYEVTVAQYAQFLQANPSQRQPNYWNEQLQQTNRPVVYVSWEDATAFCEWLSKQRGKRVRLSTEAEWEYAARGGLQGKTYPWGDESPDGKANFGNSYSLTWSEGAGKHLKNVDSFQANGYGLYNMAGNVWEWCADWYGSDYYKVSQPRNPKGPTSGTARVLRGGSWYNYASNLRCAYRNRGNPASGGRSVGFRCAQDVR
jgi:formylglycine-generating enzyme required for sulfatase activity